MAGDMGVIHLVAALVLGSLALRAFFRWLTKREPVFEGSTRPAAWARGSGARFAAKPDAEEEGASWTLHSTQRPPGEGEPAAEVSVGRQWWTLGGAGVPAPGRRTEGKEPWDPASNPNASDTLYRGGPGPSRGPVPPKDVREALRRGVERLTELQEEDGHLAGDYGGPMFLLPGLVIACHVIGHELGAARRAAMRRFLRAHQQSDGGWGLHIESASTMFGAALNYVALRLLGEREDAVCAERARAFLQKHGGAVSVPSWGKFWLALAGLYEWEGLNPIPPELWLLPAWFPFHPGRLWCHCRMVYLPMSYIYGGRFTAPVTDLTHQLRREIYTQPYDAIDWPAHRNRVSPLDMYFPHTPLMKGLHVLLGLYERVVPQFLRRRAMAFALEYIHAEDSHTNYVDIGPVNKSLNMASVWFGAGCKSSEALRKHTARIPDYLWVSEDGMKMCGYNGSQLWDTTFAMQAMYSALHAVPEAVDFLRGAYAYVDDTQVRWDASQRERFFRHVSKGGWPFSTADHGWPISDCTAEGVKVTVLARWLEQGGGPRIPQGPGGHLDSARLYDAANVLLTLQNDDGGWGTYERQRGGAWFEWLNPAEVFGDIMVDYSWNECSSASVQALMKIRKEFPEHRTEEIAASIRRGLAFLRRSQRDDGSWYGAWAVCFTYATWFGTSALRAAIENGFGQEGDEERLAAAAAFLRTKQREDGGWGETYLSCVTMQYCQNDKDGSTAPNTAWALLALLNAVGASEPSQEAKEAIDRAAEQLRLSQLPDGDWPQKSIVGIFNRNCGISYTNYRTVFPIWALGAYHKRFQAQ